MSIMSTAARQVPMVTDIAYNATAFDEAFQQFQYTAEENQKLQQQNNRILGEDVIDAYSRMRIEEYIGMQRTFSPWVRW